MEELMQMESLETGSASKKIKKKLKNRQAAYLRTEEGMSMWSDSSVMRDKKVGEQK